MSEYPIVLISGWAMPAGAMAALAEALDSDHRRVAIVQLPGLVRVPEAYRKDYDWDSLLAYLDQQLLEKPAVLVGWSLGGMLATLYASRYPDQVAAVVNLAANACFVRNETWAEGMEPELFARFCQGMSRSREKTLQQFSLLCTLGNAGHKAQAKALQAVMSEADLDHQAEDETLLPLLALLGASDIRSALADIRCPVTHMFGKDDALVPVGACPCLGNAVSGASSPGSGRWSWLLYG